MSFNFINLLCANQKITLNLSYLTIIGFAILCCFSTSSYSANNELESSDKYDNDKALAFSQAAINRTIGNHQFVNHDKKSINLAQYRGKPLIISLIFTSCHHICPTTTKHLAEITKVANEALGSDSFSVITVGFDTEVDSPERMHLYQRERNISLSNWDFLSTDKETIEAFTRDLGFIFFKSSRGFDHLSQTTLLDADGKVYRQLYGRNFEPPYLIEPLKELVFGKRTEASLVENWINNIRLFCTIYDPHSGRYQFDYSIFIGIFMGIFILGGIAVFIIRELRHNNNNMT